MTKCLLFLRTFIPPPRFFPSSPSLVDPSSFSPWHMIHNICMTKILVREHGTTSRTTHRWTTNRFRILPQIQNPSTLGSQVPWVSRNSLPQLTSFSRLLSDVSKNVFFETTTTQWRRNSKYCRKRVRTRTESYYTYNRAVQEWTIPLWLWLKHRSTRHRRSVVRSVYCLPSLSLWSRSENLRQKTRRASCLWWHDGLAVESKKIEPT
jgi:hypothetical protein